MAVALTGLNCHMSPASNKFTPPKLLVFSISLPRCVRHPVAHVCSTRVDFRILCSVSTWFSALAVLHSSMKTHIKLRTLETGRSYPWLFLSERWRGSRPFCGTSRCRTNGSSLHLSELSWCAGTPNTRTPLHASSPELPRRTSVSILGVWNCQRQARHGGRVAAVHF